MLLLAAKENEFVVCDVKKGSAAHRAGSLLPGDKILSVNGTILDQKSAEHIAQVLLQGEELISLKVERTEPSSGKSESYRKVKDFLGTPLLLTCGTLKN